MVSEMMVSFESRWSERRRKLRQQHIVFTVFSFLLLFAAAPAIFAIAVAESALLVRQSAAALLVLLIVDLIVKPHRRARRALGALQAIDEFLNNTRDADMTDRARAERHLIELVHRLERENLDEVPSIRNVLEFARAQAPAIGAVEPAAAPASSSTLIAAPPSAHLSRERLVQDAVEHGLGVFSGLTLLEPSLEQYIQVRGVEDLLDFIEPDWPDKKYSFRTFFSGVAALVDVSRPCREIAVIAQTLLEGARNTYRAEDQFEPNWLEDYLEVLHAFACLMDSGRIENVRRASRLLEEACTSLENRGQKARIVSGIRNARGICSALLMRDSEASIRSRVEHAGRAYKDFVNSAISFRLEGEPKANTSDMTAIQARYRLYVNHIDWSMDILYLHAIAATSEADRETVMHVARGAVQEAQCDMSDFFGNDVNHSFVEMLFASSESAAGKARGLVTSAFHSISTTFVNKSRPAVYVCSALLTAARWILHNPACIREGQTEEKALEKIRVLLNQAREGSGHDYVSQQLEETPMWGHVLRQWPNLSALVRINEGNPT